MTDEGQPALVIGYPGALTVAVARGLADAGVRVTLLSRREDLRGAARLAQDLGRGAQALEGAPDRIDLGLAGADYLDLADRITAILQLSLPAPPPGDSAGSPDADAAREVIELALVSPRLTRVVALSHVDVAGAFEGRFAEHDLSLGQDSGEPAQRDRQAAERRYRRFDDQLPITVVRAGWIAGTGPGLCPLAKLLLASGAAGSPIKDDTLTMPVSGLDALAASVVALALDAGEIPNTLHLIDPSPPPINALARRARAEASRLVPEAFDLAAGARRSLAATEDEVGWHWKEFFRRQVLRAQPSTELSRAVLERLGCVLPALDESALAALVSRAVEEIGGFRTPARR